MWLDLNVIGVCVLLEIVDIIVVCLGLFVGLENLGCLLIGEYVVSIRNSVKSLLCNMGGFIYVDFGDNGVLGC